MCDRGVYFAESSSKSDQYVHEPDAGGVFTMLVCRVVLGRAVGTSAGFSGLRAPCVQSGCADVRCGHERHDSLVASPAGEPREFVVFDRAQTYVELVVRYRRVP